MPTRGKKMRSERGLFWPVILVFGIVGLLYLLSSSRSVGSNEYGLMFDAGSTGSRIHVFEFKGNRELKGEIFKEVKPGLSSYADDPVKAAASLKPLLQIALDNIPPSQYSKVPIALMASAGLRQLPGTKAEQILSEVRTLFRSYQFKFDSDDDVKVMDGSVEGVYAWITVNYLLGRLGATKKPTVSIMDLGGSSTQIVFEPKGDYMQGAPEENTYNLNFGPHKYALYQNSYDRYGLMRARESVLGKADNLKSPCVPEGFSFKTNFLKDTYTSSGGSFAQCSALTSGLINSKASCKFKSCSFNGVFAPPLSDKSVFDDDMYAFSYFYDRTHVDGDKPVVTVGELKQMATKACKATDPDADHGVLCLDLSYMHSLLSDGYGLGEKQKMHIAKKINGVETAWALGAMVTMMARA